MASYEDLCRAAGQQQGQKGHGVGLIDFSSVPADFVLVRPALFKQSAQVVAEALPHDREVYLELSPGLRVIYAVRVSKFHKAVRHALAACDKLWVRLKRLFHRAKATRTEPQPQPKPLAA